MSRYESITLPPQLDDVIEKGVLEAKLTKDLNRKKRLKRVGLSLVAGMTLTLGLGFIDPAFASTIPVIGTVFEKIEQLLDYIPGNYSEYAASINETIYSGGIGITLSEVVCDGQRLYISYVIESEQPFKHGEIESKQIYLSEMFRFSFTENELNQGGAGLDGYYIDEHTYMGVMNYQLSLLETEIPNQFIFETEINGIDRVLLHRDDEGLLVFDDEFSEGDWKFSIPVTVNHELSREIDISSVKKTRISIEELILTPFEAVLTLSFGNMHTDAFDIFIYDEFNNELGYTHCDFLTDSKVRMHLLGVDEMTESLRVVVYRPSIKQKNDPRYNTEDFDYSESEVWFDEVISIK